MGAFVRILGVIFHYETVKIVDIKNKKIGVLYRIIQLLILAYIIGFVIVYKKGYQEEDVAMSTVITKVKGSTFVNYGNYSKFLNGIQVYDPSDYVIPPQEPNTFFVMTNMIITPRQIQGQCPENIEHKRNWCKSDADCQPPLEMVPYGNGVRTGKCVQSYENKSVNVCEIHGWCPVEIDVKPMDVVGNDPKKKIPLLNDAKDFTVLIRNEISFPKFDIQLRNIHGYKTRRAFRHCIYHPVDAPTCPIFKLGDILKYCGDNFTKVGYRGAIYGIHVNWDCDFDLDPDDCIPSYRFERLDDPDSPLSHGYNFRYSSYHVYEGTRYRTLTKAFGIRFNILVHTKGGRFSLVPLFVKFGAGVALMVVANLCCDILLLYCLKRKRMYKERKYETLKDDQSEEEDGEEDDDEEADVGCEAKEALLPKDE